MKRGNGAYKPRKTATGALSTPPTPRALIGLVGKKRVGKDTVAAVLAQELSLEVKHFASGIRQVCKILFGWEEYHQEADETKEVVDAYWGISPRQAMQRVGSEAIRTTFGDDFWARWLFRNWDVHAMYHDVMYRTGSPIPALDSGGWVVADVRVPEEAAAIVARGGILVRIIRPDLESADAHSTETLQDGIAVNYTIYNEGTKEEVEEVARELATTIRNALSRPSKEA